MINIKYSKDFSNNRGEMNIDIVKFVENRTMHEVTRLCKKVIYIAEDRYEISNKIVDICNEQIEENKTELQRLVDNGEKRKVVLNNITKRIKRYQRCIELLTK